MDKIILLQESSPNNWLAKYQGRYGVYTIRITTDGKQRTHFSCSCPSGASPCKHIAYVENVIAERIAENNKVKTKGMPTVADVLKDVPQKKLYDFIVRHAMYNPDLNNAILLEFLHKADDENKYSLILRKSLKEFHIHDDDYYNECGIYIDALEQWFLKAEEHIANKKYNEAILICKACIEEFADWLEEQDDEVAEYQSGKYQFHPFKILETIVNIPETNKKELYDYCMEEMKKDKYINTGMTSYFDKLLMPLAAEVNPDAYLAMQDALLSAEKDISSYGAQSILQRKIDFYRMIQQPCKAWQLIEDNIQIETFRKQVIENRIEKKQFAEAKKLISEFIGAHQSKDDCHEYYSDKWGEYLLDIAQQECDIPATQKLALNFLKDRFKEKYFIIYKSTFTQTEWPEKREHLITLYEKKEPSFSESTAKILLAENLSARLLAHIEEHLTIVRLERYYKGFSVDFPEETLALFRKVVDDYAEQNMGRSCYYQVASWLILMKKIKGGKAIITDMIEQYKVLYKNRRAMLNELKRVGATP